MNNEQEIQTAWSISHLMARRNELIGNRYEHECIERYVTVEEEE